jgi:hypothetical protein
LEQPFHQASPGKCGKPGALEKVDGYNKLGLRAKRRSVAELGIVIGDWFSPKNIIGHRKVAGREKRGAELGGGEGSVN